MWVICLFSGFCVRRTYAVGLGAVQRQGGLKERRFFLKAGEAGGLLSLQI